MLQEGDVVWVSADLLAFAFLRKIKGISMAARRQVEKTKVDIIFRELTQAVVAPNSLLVGKTLLESGFREKYTAAVVAIGRDGEVAKRLPLTTTEIKAGDVLLLEADRGFAKTNVADKGFSVLLSVRPAARSLARSLGSRASRLLWAQLTSLLWAQLAMPWHTSEACCWCLQPPVLNPSCISYNSVFSS